MLGDALNLAPLWQVVTVLVPILLNTVILGFLVSAVVEAPLGAHPSPVQGYYKRDDAYFRQYHEQTKTNRVMKT